MDTQRQSVVERLQKANNVLVTVSKNPSVDQLAACVGLALALNKLDKHATAVFSGEIPSTMEFLQPENTIEKTTDSLRDFIISLDKSKADKLRYKVEENVVRIFITPYRTSITDKDLEFSQGDFNVDVVLALGVHEQPDLDQAITAHGRILHDATVVTINNTDGGNLGGINWLEQNTSSLSEIATNLVNDLGKEVLDEQISTALLTGIVAETDRFSNEKTSADTMKASAALMAAGANQQLVATKLQEPVPIPEQSPDNNQTAAVEPADIVPQENKDGTLEIDHSAPADTAPQAETPNDKPLIYDVKSTSTEEPAQDQSQEFKSTIEPEDKPSAGQQETPSHYENPRTVVAEPNLQKPTFTSSADSKASEEPAFVNPLNLPPVDTSRPTQPAAGYPTETLQDIEAHVHSPHLNALEHPDQVPQEEISKIDESEELDLSKLQRPEGIDEEKPADIDAARDAVAQAMSATPQPPGPIEALNAQPLVDNLHPSTPPASVTMLPESPPPTDQPMTMPLPNVPPPVPNQNSGNNNQSGSAPPVPPPIMPPYQQ